MVQNKSAGRPRKFDYDETLDKAVEVFWELGFEAADTGTLTKRMGLSKPSLYNAFGAKDALFLKAIERYRATYSRQNFDALEEGDTPRTGLQAYFASVARNVSGEAAPKGCLIACVAIPTADRLPSVADYLSTSGGTGQKRVVDFFKDQIAKGNLPETYDIIAAQALMNDLSMALGMLGRLGAGPDILQTRAARYADLVLAEGMPQLN